MSEGKRSVKQAFEKSSVISKVLPLSDAIASFKHHVRKYSSIFTWSPHTMTTSNTTGDLGITVFVSQSLLAFFSLGDQSQRVMQING